MMFVDVNHTQLTHDMELGKHTSHVTHVQTVLQCNIGEIRWCKTG